MNPKSDGSTADYYKLPDGATELQDLISHRDMNAQVGEIFRACYRYGLASHSDKLRDAKKVLFYAQAEIKRLEGMSGNGSNEKRAVGGFDPSKWNLGKPLTQGDVCKMFGLPESFFDELDGDSNAPGVDYTDGQWHEWHGGECPVPGDVTVQCVTRSGHQPSWRAGHFYWTHNGDGGDIIRFRVVK